MMMLTMPMRQPTAPDLCPLRIGCVGWQAPAIYQSLPLPEYTLGLYLAYVFYPPLYIAGPVMTFNAFAANVASRARPPWKTTLLYVLRLGASLLVLELMTHFLYFNAIAKHRVWAKRHRGGGGPAFRVTDVGITAFWVLNFMWLKVRVDASLQQRLSFTYMKIYPNAIKVCRGCPPDSVLQNNSLFLVTCGPSQMVQCAPTAADTALCPPVSGDLAVLPRRRSAGRDRAPGEHAPLREQQLRHRGVLARLARVIQQVRRAAADHWFVSIRYIRIRSYYYIHSCCYVHAYYIHTVQAQTVIRGSITCFNPPPA